MALKTNRKLSMAQLLGRIRSMFPGRRGRFGVDDAAERERLGILFRERYQLFRRLLVANGRALSIMTEMELALGGGRKFALPFVKAGATTVGVHVETCPHLHRTVAQVRETGARACVVLNPATPAEMVRPVLGETDQVLVAIGRRPLSRDLGLESAGVEDEPV